MKQTDHVSDNRITNTNRHDNLTVKKEMPISSQKAKSCKWLVSSGEFCSRQQDFTIKYFFLSLNFGKKTKQKTKQTDATLKGNSCPPVGGSENISSTHSISFWLKQADTCTHSSDASWGKIIPLSVGEDYAFLLLPKMLHYHSGFFFYFFFLLPDRLYSKYWTNLLQMWWRDGEWAMQTIQLCI